MKGVRYLSDAERFPLLSDEGRSFLNWMLEHPNAPRYNYRCGDQLTREGLSRVRAYEEDLRLTAPNWRHGEVPDWVLNFAERCLQDVPFYRGYRDRGCRAEDVFSIPTCSRSDLEAAQWAFVPDSQSLAEMIIYYTSGTTGKPFHIPSHAEVSSKYLVTLRAALARIGVTLEGGRGRVSILNPCAQSSSLTYATVSSYLDEAVYVKINLNPTEWKSETDPERFIDDCEAEIYTGDPIAFLALKKLALKKKPKALVSSAMTLMPAVQKELEEHFECPVLDVYSMNETRFIAAGSNSRHEIAPHDLYVEILDAEGNSCPPGMRGGITVTCPRNPFLPLLRYRTGDYAALSFSHTRPLLVGFAGRQPVLFVDSQGRTVNNIDVTQTLESIPMGQFSLHQNVDLSLTFKVRGGHFDRQQIETALRTLFGAQLPVRIQTLNEAETREGKILQYSTEVDSGTLFGAELTYKSASP